MAVLGATWAATGHDPRDAAPFYGRLLAVAPLTYALTYAVLVRGFVLPRRRWWWPASLLLTSWIVGRAGTLAVDELAGNLPGGETAHGPLGRR